LHFTLKRKEHSLQLPHTNANMHDQHVCGSLELRAHHYEIKFWHFGNNFPNKWKFRETKIY